MQYVVHTADVRRHSSYRLKLRVKFIPHSTGPVLAQSSRELVEELMKHSVENLDLSEYLHAFSHKVCQFHVHNSHSSN